MSATTVQIRRKGVITLPAVMRRRYSLSEGDIFTFIDLEDGTFLLSPKISRLAQAGDKVADLLAEDDISLDDLLEALDQERSRYYQEHYAQA